VPCLAAHATDGQKKRLIASEQDPEQRAVWREAITGIPAERLVFVDESGATIMLTPAYGRAPRGARCLGRVPRNWGLRTTLLAALTLDGITASFLIDGATDRQVFDTYVERVLVPTLRPGQVVVWDNLSAHKSVRARAAIEAAGCEVVFLPAYSPDYNPIEQAFSKLKSGLRRAGERTHAGLWEAIGSGLAQITSRDAQGWFSHCGYPATGQ
jgi:transposase